jgi:MSHA pilin protein MshC
MSVVNIRHKSGFSLVELLAVIVMLGILGVAALGRLGDGTEADARGFYDDTVAAVGFAQKFAISSGCDVRVVMSVGGYQLRQSSTCTADNFTNPVPNPANRASNYQSGTIPAGYSLTTGNITFDARGLREEATSDFTLSNGSDSYSFRVHAGSGLVEKL